MDQSLLVSQAQALTKRLDSTKIKPRVVMWVHQADVDVWRLWIVPADDKIDKREFYRILAETISKYDNEMNGLDVGMTEFVKSDHPAVKGISGFIRVEGTSSVGFGGNVFNGFYLPEGILVRAAA